MGAGKIIGIKSGKYGVVKLLATQPEPFLISTMRLALERKFGDFEVVVLPDSRVRLDSVRLTEILESLSSVDTLLVLNRSYPADTLGLLFVYLQSTLKHIRFFVITEEYTSYHVTEFAASQF